MRLAGKLSVTIAVAILVVMAGHTYLQLRNEVTLFDEDLKKSMRFGRAFRHAVEAVWQRRGEAKARRLVALADEGVPEVKISWKWLDVPEGDPDRPAVSPAQLETLKAGQPLQFIEPDEEDGSRRFTYVPISVQGGRPAAIEVKESLSGMHRFLRTTHSGLALAVAIVVLLCTTAVMALGFWWVGRPIRRLRDKARAVGAGEYGPPLALRQRDEIGQLAREIDLMADSIAEARRQLAAETEARIAALEQMRHTDRLTTMGQLASGVAHEIGTPLNVISGRAELIATGEAVGAEAAANGRIILEQANQMGGLIRQLLDFSRRQGPRFGVASLRAIATRTLELLASYARRRRITLELDAPEDPLLVSADQNQIQQALTNLVMNGLQAMPDGGRLTVRIAPRTAAPPGEPAGAAREYVCLQVEDQGHGIAPEHVLRIFEPFFTTKGMGEGTGLGLSVAYGIVQEHGGWIAVESEVGKGTRFSVYLPRAAGAAAPAEVAS
jgi:signal transduction histidine kinase